MLFAEQPIIRRHPLAVIRVLARFHLVYQVPHRQRMILRRAEHQRLLVLVDLLHEQLHAMRFAFFDLDNPIEVALHIPLPRLNLPFN